LIHVVRRVDRIEARPALQAEHLEKRCSWLEGFLLPVPAAPGLTPFGRAEGAACSAGSSSMTDSTLPIGLTIWSE
jgi:hypothetical protein